MGTFRPVLSRWIFAAAVFCGSFTSLGAAFAPSSPFLQEPFDSRRLASFVDAKAVLDLNEVKHFFSSDKTLKRAKELALTHHTLSVAA